MPVSLYVPSSSWLTGFESFEGLVKWLCCLFESLSEESHFSGFLLTLKSAQNFVQDKNLLRNTRWDEQPCWRALLNNFRTDKEIHFKISSTDSEAKANKKAYQKQFHSTNSFSVVFIWVLTVVASCMAPNYRTMHGSQLQLEQRYVACARVWLHPSTLGWLLC